MVLLKDLERKNKTGFHIGRVRRTFPKNGSPVVFCFLLVDSGAETHETGRFFGKGTIDGVNYHT
jgi:hypothetical protein